MNPYEGLSICRHGFVCSLVPLGDGRVQPVPTGDERSGPCGACREEDWPLAFVPGANPRGRPPAPSLDRTDELFSPGRLTLVLDGQAGSSGKGKLASFACARASNWQFACNAFSAQAGHWVRLGGEPRREFFYQHLPSCAWDPDRYERLLIGPDAVLEVEALLRELEENRVPPTKLGISPFAAVIRPQDREFEQGTVDFDGRPTEHAGTIATGSTCHGVGAARARKLLRRHDALLARDVVDLRPFLCDVPAEILDRLDRGQAGLLEAAQGYQLSLNGRFYPHVTSRNVSASAALEGVGVPPRYLGNVVLNFRTFPIRICSDKYVGPGGRHLSWAEVEEGVPHRVVRGDSGGWYPDQRELSWEDVTRSSGSTVPLRELTSVTKLPRRVATFSRENLREAVRFNRPTPPFRTFVSVNFANYVDAEVLGKRALTSKVARWLKENVLGALRDSDVLRYVGTGPELEHVVVLDDDWGRSVPCE